MKARYSGAVLVGTGGRPCPARRPRAPCDGSCRLPGLNGKIAVVSDRDGNCEIYTMKVDGSSQINVTNSWASGVCAGLSPDGRKIAFVSDRDGSAEIYTMAADGSDVRRLTNNPTPGRGPAFSPDGERITFVREPPPSPFPRRPVHEISIFAMAPDGAEGFAFTDNTSDANPDYSPDGRSIVFARNRFRHQKSAYDRGRRLGTGPHHRQHRRRLR